MVTEQELSAVVIWTIIISGMSSVWSIGADIGQRTRRQRMQWFKGKKQKRIEELEKQLEQQLEQFKHVSSYYANLADKVGELSTSINNMRVYANRVETPKTETIIARCSVPRDMPVATDDIERMLANELCDGVVKHMIVHKDFDPRKQEDVYCALVKVVAYPSELNTVTSW